MLQNERWESPELAQEAALDRLQSRLWTKLPCQVVKVYADGQHVDLQPTISVLVRTVSPNGTPIWTPTTLPILPMVPIKFPSGGGYTLTFPVSEGDEGTVSFSSRCIDNWWLLGGVQPQLAPNNSGSLRKHNLSDGFFELGGRSKPKLLENVSSSATQLRSDDGSCYMQFSESGFSVVFSGGSFTIDPSGNVSNTGYIHSQEEVIAKYGSGASVTLSGHEHAQGKDSAGDSEVPTNPPTPGT